MCFYVYCCLLYDIQERYTRERNYINASLLTYCYNTTCFVVCILCINMYTYGKVLHGKRTFPVNYNYYVFEMSTHKD